MSIQRLLGKGAGLPDEGLCDLPETPGGLDQEQAAGPLDEVVGQAGHHPIVGMGSPLSLIGGVWTRAAMTVYNVVSNFQDARLP